ncbi:hypothetical protein, conserved [Angomonas deanei]|uniref:Uncharacterized protein n=1 Tax=Angomonas deanei TaxID=59799 RepID=A0A7G2C1M7_9TRYP|nr:hypothetical protein, conserved [Angomonas deanei]
MYYATAEVKSKGFFSTSWEKCVVCFDVDRRHLLVSKPVKQVFNLTSGVVQWKRCLKVKSFSLPAKESDLIEDALYQVDFLTEKRPLGKESVALNTIEPSLLCPSTSLKVPLSRFVATNEDFLRDPYYLYELYEGIKDRLTRLSRERDASRPSATTNQPSSLHTIDSPREGGSSESYLLSIRLPEEYQYRRFVYVVQSVLGYDGLMKKPTMGYPPYDPRNLLSYGYVPLKLQRAFANLEKSVFYIFTGGNLLGLNNSNTLQLTHKNIFLCITHDFICVFSVDGKLKRWINLMQLKTFYHNDRCVMPYMCFVADRNMRNVETPSDILFLPSQSPNSPPTFDPSTEVSRVKHIVEELHSGLMEVRRVVQVSAASEETPQAFATNFPKTNHGESLQLLNPRGPPPSVEETVLTAWQERRRAMAASQTENGVPAVPLHVEGGALNHLTRRQLAEINERLREEGNLTYDQAVSA